MTEVKLRIGHYYEYIGIGSEDGYRWYFKVIRYNPPRKLTSGKMTKPSYKCICLKDMTIRDNLNWKGSNFDLEAEDLNDERIKIKEIPEHEVALLILECDNE